MMIRTAARLILLVLILQSIILADIRKIEAARQQGELSAGRYLYYTYLDIFSPDQLPENMKSVGVPVPRCRFGQIAELRSRLNEVEEPYQSLMRSTLGTRPGGLPYTYLSPSQHFLIHYAKVGTDAVDSLDANQNQIPDYVEETAVIFDHVYQVEIETMNLKKYKEDTIDGVQFDIYIKSLQGYGYTDWDESSCTHCTPFITIDNDFKEDMFLTKGLDAVRITAAHEFFHALQVNYRWDAGTASSNIYWYEISSVWMEDVIYDSLNDYYQYLDTYFKNTNSSLTAYNGWVEYSKALLAFYMAESYSPDIIRQLWEDFAAHSGRVPHVCFDQVLPGGFVSNFLQFAYWNSFTGTQIVTDSFFNEAAAYPELTLSEWSSSESMSVTINPLAIKYYTYHPSRNGGVRLSYDPGCTGFIKGIGYDGTHYTVFFNPSLGSQETAIFPNLSLYRQIIIGLVNPSTSAINSSFTLAFDSTLCNIGFIEGQITNRKGEPLDQVHVKAYHPSSGQVIGLTQSSSTGGFSLPIMDTYLNQSLNLKLEAQGYAIEEMSDIVAAQLQDSVLTIQLSPLSEKQIGPWPNPFNNKLYWGFYQAYEYPETEGYHLQIYTLDGRIVYQDQGNGILNQIEIPAAVLDKLGSGVYVYYFKLGSTLRKGKLIRKRE